MAKVSKKSARTDFSDYNEWNAPKGGSSSKTDFSDYSSWDKTESTSQEPSLVAEQPSKKKVDTELSGTTSFLDSKFKAKGPLFDSKSELERLGEIEGALTPDERAQKAEDARQQKIAEDKLANFKRSIIYDAISASADAAYINKGFAAGIVDVGASITGLAGLLSNFRPSGVSTGEYVNRKLAEERAGIQPTGTESLKEERLGKTATTNAAYEAASEMSGLSSFLTNDAKKDIGISDEDLQKGPVDLFREGKITDGLKVLSVEITKAIPNVIVQSALAPEAGVGFLAQKAATFATTSAMALGGNVAQEYAQDKEISAEDILKGTAKAAIEGLTESFFMGDIKALKGIGSSLAKGEAGVAKELLKGVIEKEGKEAAKQEIARGFSKPLAKMLGRGFEGASVVGQFNKGGVEEGIEEVMSTVGSFIVDRVADGNWSDADYNQLVKDASNAFVIGYGSGGMMNGVSAQLSMKGLTDEQKSKVEKFNEVANNENLPAEVRKIAKDKADDIIRESADMSYAGYDELAKIPVEQRVEAFTLLSQINAQEASKKEVKDVDIVAEIDKSIQAKKDQYNYLLTGIKPATEAAKEEAPATEEQKQVQAQIKTEQEAYQEELAKAQASFNVTMGVPTEPMKFTAGFSVKTGGEDITPNNEFSPSPNYPLEVQKQEGGKRVQFTTKTSPDALLEADVYTVNQRGNKFATILSTKRNGVQEYYVPELENDKPFSNLDDAKFAVQEKLTGVLLNEKERSGIDRLRADKYIPKADIVIKNDNGQEVLLDPKAKKSISNAVKAFKSVSAAPVYLYRNTEDFKKGVAKELGEDSEALEAAGKVGGGFFTNARDEDSIHINLANISETTIAHELFHGTVVNVARQNPSAFAAMRDAIINKLGDSDLINVYDEKGKLVKLTAKEYLDRYSKQYSPDQQAEEFLSELTGLLATDMAKLKDTTIWETIKLAIRNLVKTAGIDIPIFDETANTNETVQFFRDLSKSLKTGKEINLGKLKITNEKQTTKQGAAVQATNGESQIAEEDAGLRDTVSDAVEKKQRRSGNPIKKKDRPPSKEGVRALAIEPVNPSDYVYQYFAKNGQVLRGNKDSNEKDALFSLFSKGRQGVKKEATKELQDRVNMIDNRENGALSISEIAEKLFAEYQQATKGDVGIDVNTPYDYMDFRNAVENAILGYKSGKAMAIAMLESKNQSTEEDAMALTEDEEFDKLRIQAEAAAMGMTYEEFKAKLAEFEGNPTIGAIEDAYAQALDMINDEDMAKLYELSDEDVAKIDELMANLDDNTGKLDDKLAEQKKVVRDLEAERKKVIAAIEKAGKETQLDITGKAPIQEQLFGADTKSLTDNLNAIDTQLAAAKADVAATQSAIDFQERGTVEMFKKEAPVAEAEESFFKNKPNSRRVVIDAEKIKEEKPQAYEYLKTFKGYEDFTINDIKGVLVAAYNSMMKYKSGAEIKTEQISQIEDIIDVGSASNTTTKEKFKSDMKQSGDFTNAELLIYNEVVDSLNTDLMPEYNSSKESLKLIGINADKYLNFYALPSNILRASQPQTFIHEIGHFSFYNILSKQDRIEFLKGMIDSTYGNKGKSLASRIAMTSEKAEYKDAFRTFQYKTNVADNFSEYFAEQFQQWYVGKNLNPSQFDTIFAKVEKFLQKLVDKLKSGDYIDQSLVKYFEKISSARGAAIAEQTKVTKAESAAESKVAKEINSIQGEIESYERDIEDATEEIENTKYNYRETATEIKEKKAALAKEKLSRDEREERKEELDAELEDAADERDTYIEQYKDTIADAKAEIKKLNKRLAKLQQSEVSAKLQKQEISVASAFANTNKVLKDKFNIKSVAGEGGAVVAKYQSMALRHGSPYNFNKFTLSKVGAGEGQQVYGYGLYFSEDPNIATAYSRSNQGNKLKNLGILNKVPESKREELYKMMQQSTATINDVKKWLNDNKGFFGLAIPANVREQVEKAFGERALYTVQVESQDWRNFKWLDWSKPLTNADIYVLGSKAKSIIPEMQRALNGMINQQKSKPGSFKQSEYNEAINIINMAEIIGDAARSGRFSNMTGKDFYQTIQKSLGSQKNTSELLYMFGYDGVRVPTYFMLSGGKDTGKSNYVVFNDRNIKIVNKQVAKFQKQGMSVAPKSIEDIKSKNPDVELDLYENKSTKEISLSKIVVPKEMRNQGVGTEIMHDVTRYADANQSRINLTPSNEFGGIKSRLVNFYKGFGFVENKGKNRDFSTREDMYRLPLEEPAKGQPNAVFTTLRTDKPIGFNYDTDLVARERFNIPSLKRIGEGSDRVVFDLGGNKVLKVAKTARGLAQNMYEGSYDLVEEGIIPEAFETGLNYIVTEKVETAKGSKAVNDLMRELKKFTQRDFDNRTSELQDVLVANDLDYVMNYDILYGDFSAARNWGVKNGKPIHLDGGTFGGVRMINQFSGVKNLEDDDFREVYYKSRQAKSEFKDTDTFTKFQKQGISVAPAYKYQMNEIFKDPERLIADITNKYDLKTTLRERGRIEGAVVEVERKLADNLVIEALSKVAKTGFKTIGAVENLALYKSGEQKDVLVKDLLMQGPKWMGDRLRNVTLKAIQSNNKYSAQAGRAAASLIGNLAKTSTLQQSRKVKEGLVKDQNNQIAMLGKSLNGMIANDKNSLMRVHSLLDPEAFVEEEGAAKSPADLSLMELRLYNVLRDMNDFIHEWHFQNEFIDVPTYEKHKGKYFARMYEEIERKEFADLHEAIDKLPSGADFRMFKERKDFSEVELTLMNDPIYITSKRFATMIHNKAVLDFCNVMANDPAYKTYKKLDDVPENNRAGFKLLESAGGGKRYGELTKRYVPIALYEELRGTAFANKHISSLYDVLRGYDGMPSRQYLKKSLTIWQPTTRLGNITSNFAFGWLAGIDPFTMIKNRVKAKDSLDNYDDWARELSAEGLLGTDIITSDLAQRKKQAERDKPNFVDKIFLDKYAKGEQALVDKLVEKGFSKEKIDKAKQARAKAVAKAIELDKYLVDSYGRTDDISKIALYRSLVDDYGKNKEEALKIVAESMQNYATVGKSYQFFSKMPLLGNPFVKFSSDLARIITNGLVNRPLYMASFLGMLYGMHRLLSGLSGEPEEEREARVNRPFIPKIPLGFTDIPLVWKIGNKEFNVARFITPYYIYDAGYRSNTLAELSKFGPLQLTFEDKVGVISDYMPTFGDPTLAPLAQLVTDKDFRAMNIADPYESIYTRQTVTEDEAALNRLNYLGKSYLSPAWGMTANLISAAKGEPDVYGRRRDIAGAILNNVIKVQDIESADVQKFVTNEIKYIDSEYKQVKTDITSRRNKDADRAMEIYESDLSDEAKIKKIEAIDKQYNIYVNEMIQKQQELMERRAIPVSRLYNLQNPKNND